MVNKKMKGSFIDKLFFCGEVWKVSFKGMWQCPAIFLPFAFIALCETILLLVLLLSPHPIMEPLLGPPIRRFFGEMFLHYPYNFSLLPTLFEYADLPLTLILMPLMCAVTIGMAALVVNGEKASFKKNLKLAIKKYVPSLSLWIIVLLVYIGIFMLLKFLALHCYPPALAKILHIPSWRMLTICQYMSLFVCLLVEPFLAYAMPIMILEKKKLFSAIKEGIIVGWSLYLPTMVLLAVPALFGACVVLVKQKMLSFFINILPESVLSVMAGGFILMLFIGVLMTTSLTVLFLIKRQGINE
ncbi:hypothetical protein KKE26_08465 [bacterium]|nr:hypothetical protein [bacterium]MBU1753394.1 hypothetical protein [bacterium]